MDKKVNRLIFLLRMSFKENMKKAIFQESFYGSLNCRLNQGQLESKGLLLDLYLIINRLGRIQ